MDDDVGSVFDGANEGGGGYGVVYDDGDAVFVGHGGDGFDVYDVASGVADGFAVYGGGFVVYEGFEASRGIVRGEADFYALFGKHVGEEGVGTAIEKGDGDDVVALFGDGKDRVVDGGAACTKGEGANSAF